MAVAIVDNAVSAITTNGTTLTLSTPASAASGHLLIAAIGIDEAPTDIAMTDWDSIGTLTQAGNTITIALFKLQLSSSPAASYDATWTGSNQSRGAIIAISGHNTTTPIHQNQSSSSGLSATFTPTGVTTTTADCLVLSCIAVDRRLITAVPETNETTLIASDSSSAESVSIGVAYQTKAAAGSTSHDEWSVAASADEWTGWVVAVAPAAAAAGGSPILLMDHFNGGGAL